MQFILVYIREAHPADGWAKQGWSEGVADPKTLAKRRETAVMACAKLDFSFPAIVDKLDDQVAIRWGANPERLFLISASGRVLYTGDQGPWGFHPSKAFRPFGRPNAASISLEACIEQHLARTKAKPANSD